MRKTLLETYVSITLRMNASDDHVARFTVQLGGLIVTKLVADGDNFSRRQLEQVLVNVHWWWSDRLGWTQRNQDWNNCSHRSH
eukprot:COSAG02_NODE_47549_length_340_cov_0.858921_1_plen_82_part_01